MRIAFRLVASGALFLGACAEGSTFRESVPVASASAVADSPARSTPNAPTSTLSPTTTAAWRVDERGFILRPTRRGGGTTTFRVTIPNGHVVDVSLPGEAGEALVEPSIALVMGDRTFGGGMFRMTTGGASFVSGPCAPTVREHCTLSRRTTPRPGVTYEEHRVGNSERHLAFVVFGEWAMLVDSELAAGLDVRTDGAGFPVVRPVAEAGYATERPTVALYTDTGGRYRVTADVDGACAPEPPTLACRDGVTLTGGPAGEGASVSLVGAASTTR